MKSDIGIIFKECQTNITYIIHMLENLRLTHIGTIWTLSDSWYNSFLYNEQNRKAINGKDKRTID